MPELSSKSPRENYASRSAQDRPNIAYPDGAVAVEGEEARAAVELADDQPSANAVSVDATGLADLQAAVDAAITDAGESAAVLALLTESAILAITSASPDVTFATER